ncbi:MAG: glycosyltransferase [Microgenomates group bacterium]
MNKTPFFSIIIPVRVETAYLVQTLLYLKKQTYKSFEVLVITDKISLTANPAQKRNVGAKMSKGKYLAFIDDDSYPDPNWLKNLFKQIKLHTDYSAFCGPCLTPPDDDIYQQASGLIWSSFLGSGGAGVYRNHISAARLVDDFPSVNLTVKKSDFNHVKGFDTHHWPGEDTILCLNLINLDKKIYYHPTIIVYHHRRPVIIAHLQQITRYALHRGHFARVFPKTSFKIGYLIPSIFTLYCLSLFILHSPYFTIPLYIYLLLLLITFLQLKIKNLKFKIIALAIATIPITHLYYGVLFIIGFLSPKLKFSQHKIDSSNQYLGG